MLLKTKKRSCFCNSRDWVLFSLVPALETIFSSLVAQVWNQFFYTSAWTLNQFVFTNAQGLTGLPSLVAQSLGPAPHSQSLFEAILTPFSLTARGLEPAMFSFVAWSLDFSCSRQAPSALSPSSGASTTFFLEVQGLYTKEYLFQTRTLLKNLGQNLDKIWTGKLGI